MGIALSCLEKVQSMDRIQYDMKPLKEKKLPVIWLVGQQNTGKRTHGNFLQEKFNFEHISISQLLRNEATKDTDRGKTIKESLNLKKNVPDEALLKSTSKQGFIISNFPKNSKQAEMFVKEIGHVNFILYLYTETKSLIERAQGKLDNELNEDILKRNIDLATKDIKAALTKFEFKVENINTSSSIDDVSETIESALIERLNLTRPMVETDYLRPHEIEEEI